MTRRACLPQRHAEAPRRTAFLVLFAAVLSASLLLSVLASSSWGVAVRYDRIGIIGRLAASSTGAPGQGGTTVAVDGQGLIYADGTFDGVRGLYAWSAAGTSRRLIAPLHDRGNPPRTAGTIRSIDQLVGLPSGVMVLDLDDVKVFSATGDVVRTWSATPLPGSPHEQIVSFGEFVNGIAITPQHVVLASAETGLWHLNLSSGAIISHAPSSLYSVIQPVVAPDGSIYGTQVWSSVEHWDAAGLERLGSFGRPALYGPLPDGSLPPVTPDLFAAQGDPGQVSVATDGSVWIPAPQARRIVHVDFQRGALDVCERTGHMSDAQAQRIGTPVATAIAADGTVWVATRSDLMHLGPVTSPAQLCDPDPPAITNVKPNIRYTKSRKNTVRITRAKVAATISEQATVTVTLDRLRTGGRGPLRVSSFPPTLLYERPTPYPLPHLVGHRIPTGRYRITVRARNDSGNRTTATKIVRIAPGKR